MPSYFESVYQPDSGRSSRDKRSETDGAVSSELSRRETGSEDSFDSDMRPIGFCERMMMCMGMQTRPSKEDRTVSVGPWDEAGFGGGKGSENRFLLLLKKKKEKKKRKRERESWIGLLQTRTTPIERPLVAVAVVMATTTEKAVRITTLWTTKSSRPSIALCHSYPKTSMSSFIESQTSTFCSLRGSRGGER